MPLQTRDFWRVNSYGYPNPFSSDSKPLEAWATFCSFFDSDGGSYAGLKTYWNSPRASRRLDSAAVESWKATFEEFGLLYVISRSDTITVTPAGKQFHAAAQERDVHNFVWIGLNLLIRYPVKGPPRGRSRSHAHATANILPYRFLFSAMRDLGGYFWWSEMERVFCRVFSTADAKNAIDIVRFLRANPTSLETYPLPVDQRKGAFYNSLNQVANHAGMNHLVFSQDNASEYYGTNESRRRHLINRDYLNLVSIALGDSATPSECGSSAMYIDRLPAAPNFTDEQEYFDYLGAPVPSFSAVENSTAPQTINLAGDTVFVLDASHHFQQLQATGAERVIQGETAIFCRIARNHRVILSTDLNWTYLVVEKDLIGPNVVKLSLRRARPITNVEPIQILLGDQNA